MAWEMQRRGMSQKVLNRGDEGGGFFTVRVGRLREHEATVLEPTRSVVHVNERPGARHPEIRADHPPPKRLDVDRHAVLLRQLLGRERPTEVGLAGAHELLRACRCVDRC